MLDDDEEYDFHPESFEDAEDVKTFVQEFNQNTKTGQIISIADHGPHVVIQTDTSTNVYPLVYFRNYLAGDPSMEPPPPNVVRAIVREWFEGLEQGGKR